MALQNDFILEITLPLPLKAIDCISIKLFVTICNFLCSNNLMCGNLLMV